MLYVVVIGKKIDSVAKIDTILGQKAKFFNPEGLNSVIYLKIAGFITQINHQLRGISTNAS